MAKKPTYYLSGVHYQDSDPALLFLEEGETGDVCSISIADFPGSPIAEYLRSDDAFTVGYLFCQETMLRDEKVEMW